MFPLALKIGMVHWRLSARKYRPPLVGFTQKGIQYRYPPPWTLMESKIRTQWSLVCQEVEQKQWKLRKPRVTFDDHWRVVCSDVENYQWNMQACALWHPLKIEFLLSNVQKDLSHLCSPKLDSPVKNVDHEELTLFGVITPSDSEVSSVSEGMVRVRKKSRGSN